MASDKPQPQDNTPPSEPPPPAPQQPLPLKPDPLLVRHKEFSEDRDVWVVRGDNSNE
jgi:hypothetical protein